MMTDQQHPVFEYRDKVLRDKGKFNTPGLDEMVLNRWDSFMEEGNFRYQGNTTSVFLFVRGGGIAGGQNLTCRLHIHVFFYIRKCRFGFSLEVS